MVEEVAVAVRGRPQLRHVLREELRVVAVDLRHVRHQLRQVVVVRQRMVRLRHPDLRVGARALLLADHERDHPRQVGLEGEELQVEHQLQVVLEDRRRALRLPQLRQLQVVLLLRPLDPPLDVAHRLGVLVELHLVVHAEFALQVGELAGHRVEQALVLAHPRQTRLAVGAAAVAEEGLEDRARIPLHRQRLRLAAPRDGVRVDAAQVARAGAGVVRAVEGHGERRHLGLPREVPGQKLVHRDLAEDLGLVAAAARHAGQERPGGAGVDVVPARVEPGEHDRLVAERRERLEDGRQLEARPLPLRRPVRHGHAVGDVERLEARRGLGGGPRRGHGRGHRVEERQRERRADASENRPPGQRLVDQGHVRGLLSPRRSTARTPGSPPPPARPAS